VGTLSALARREVEMTYRIAGIDVHKKMLAVVVADVAVEGSFSFSATPSAPVPRSCGRWPSGCWSSRSTKW
jgi:hypothetical protein